MIDNRRHARRVVVLMQSRRLLRDRFSSVDHEFCLRSAVNLREAVQIELLVVEDSGPLLEVLKDFQRACSTFIGAAGAGACTFRAEPDLFEFHLRRLREVVARGLTQILGQFDLERPPEIDEIITAGQH